MISRAQRTSRLRQQLRQQWEELGRVMNGLGQIQGILRGSLYLRERKCGKSGCRCQRGQLHRDLTLSVRHEGQSRRKSLKGVDVEKLRSWVNQYRQFRRGRAKMVKLFGQMLVAVDGVGKLQEVQWDRVNP